MDFRTEWSSYLLILLMMIIAFVVYPYAAGENIPSLLLQVIGLPLATIAIACIPVIIFCYFIKVIPDIDYSIRLAFVYFLFLLVRHFI
ncbi:MAG: hypothetical protein AAGK97_00700 [Bacteroidota bacterium]